MKNLHKNLLYLFIFLISFSACQNVQDGLTGVKKSNSDEFLVQKKNPLVLPPDYDKLPEPETLGIKSEDTEETNLQTIIDKDLSSFDTKSKVKTTNGPLEKSIMEKIKKN
jgi:hypothetical protein